MAEAVVNMVDQLTMPGDREPFMDAVRKEVAAWFRRHQLEKRGNPPPAGGPPKGSRPKKGPVKRIDQSLRSINQALKGVPKQKNSKKP